MTPIASPLAMSAVRAYEPDYHPSDADMRIQAATRGHPLDAEELRALRLIADGAVYPGAHEGCCRALEIRGYAEYTLTGWRVTTRGEWFLDRVGRYAIPAHEIARLIREADDGARHLATATEIPVDAWDALTEARRLLALAQKQVAEALRVVQPVAAKAAAPAARAAE